MKRFFYLITLAAAVLILASCASGETKCEKRAFTNPVWATDWPDPTAIYNEADGYYYSAATGWNRPFIRSKNLTDWEQTEICPLSEACSEKLKEYGHAIWAPQFAQVNGKYLLYLTMRNTKEDSKIAAVVSDSVTGPYEFGGIITEGLVTGIWDTIDPFVFTEESTGKVWMIFGSVGCVHRIELAKDGCSKIESCDYKHVAGRNYLEDPARLTVYEGSYVYYRDGYYYLFCSPGRYNDYSYAIAVGRSQNPEGPYLDKDGKDMAEGNATVILSTSPYEHFYGPGHNGEIFTDKSGDTYMIYHVHIGDYKLDRLAHGYIHRPMNLQQIYWDEEGWPYFKHEEIEGGTINL